MVGIQKIEHAQLQVSDLEAAREFFVHGVGLTEIDHDDGVVYLGCGLDANYDLAVVEGGTGVEHFAIRVPNEAAIIEYETQLAEKGVDANRTDGREPNQTHGLRFSLPSGIDMEFVTVSDNRYRHELDPALDRTMVTPIDLDHITLRMLDVQPNAEFLRDTLGFEISDVRKTSQGFWRQAFTRYGDYHHDVAMFAGSDRDETLHHLAWTMRDINHIKEFCDNLSSAGYGIELGIGRHNAGSNLYIYAIGPGGNRHEFCAEATTLDESTPTSYEDRTSTDKVSAWGTAAPKSFKTEGS